MLIVVLNPATVLGRSADARRKSDLRSIQGALELYRSDNGKYPTAASSGILVNCAGAFTGPGGQVYSQKIPCDPKGTSQAFNSGGNYYYYVDPTNQAYYYLVACLQLSSDSDGVAFPAGAGAPSGSCASGKYFVTQNP